MFEDVGYIQKAPKKRSRVRNELPVSLKEQAH
jgi:hypothetical protein